MTYLMQNVCRLIFFFPKTILFLAMLLVCERFHLYLRMDKIGSLLKIKSLTIFKEAGYFSVECMRSVEEHINKTGPRLTNYFPGSYSECHECQSLCTELGPVIRFFRLFILCKLSCRSSSLYI